MDSKAAAPAKENNTKPAKDNKPRAPRAPKAAGGEKSVPKNRDGQKSAALPADSLKISSESRPRSVAGAIAGSLRDGKNTSLNAIGAKSVYASIKSLITARKYVTDDKFDMVIKPTQIEAVGPDAIRIDVEKVSGAITDADVATENQLRLSGTTKTGALAGALAGKVRDGSKSLCITGIGPTAILRMVKAVALARSYIDKDGFDLEVAVRFVSLSVSGEAETSEERTGVRFDVFAKNK